MSGLVGDRVGTGDNPNAYPNASRCDTRGVCYPTRLPESRCIFDTYGWQTLYCVCKGVIMKPFTR